MVRKTTIKKDQFGNTITSNENVKEVPTREMLPVSSKVVGGTKFLDFAPPATIEEQFTPEKKASIAEERRLTQEQVEQQPQQPQQQPQTTIEKIATLGMKPAEIYSNIINRGITLLSGKPFEWQNTAQQLAETTFGKVVGVGTVAGVAIAGAELAAAAIPSLVGVGGVKAVVGANVIKGGLLTKALSSNVLKLSAIGLGVGTPIKIQNDARSAIVSSIQSADLIIDSVQAGAMSPIEAIIQFDMIEQQITSLEKSMNTWGNLSVLNWLGGGKDRLVDVANAKANLQLKRQMLIAIMGGAR